jgi:hypothetical protein
MYIKSLINKDKMNMKAKIGDTIQSFNDINCQAETRESVIGEVVKIEQDKWDDVEYVYFQPLFYVDGYDISKVRVGASMFVVPQNGTPTQLGNVTKGIKILK